MQFRAILSRRLAVGIAAMAAGAAVTVSAGPAPHAATTLACTNPVSHASWQIHINFARSTVDSNPARIRDATISWHDRKNGGNYTLDRRTGQLTAIFASSTGGYFLHYRCEPDRSNSAS